MQYLVGGTPLEVSRNDLPTRERVYVIMNHEAQSTQNTQILKSVDLDMQLVTCHLNKWQNIAHVCVKDDE